MAVALAVLAWAFIVVPAAQAGGFAVDSTADEVDAAPGDEHCLTAGGSCTLRAAIEEADSFEESATIEFEEEVFKGLPTATIALGSSLPSIAVPMFINGRTCDTAAGVEGPCVGIDGPSGESALAIDEAEGVEIWGLAITGAQTAIQVKDSPHFMAQASWFGVKLDGSPGPNATGILIGSGSDKSLIGSEGAERRNVFAANSADGLDIHGASNVRVLGNYFGVEPDGVTPAANGGDDIEVASVEGFEAVGTSIGIRVSVAAAASAQCDGGCNVISGAGENGVDLGGDGEPEAAAVSTAVAGNYIGLDAAGTAPVANQGAGVRVGKAVHAVLGGPATGEANRIDGGSAAVLAGPAAADLEVIGNVIGAGVGGGGALAPPDAGIVVDSAELPGPLAEAQIVGNELWMDEGAAIAQRGEGAWILDNRIFGSQIGIATSESTAGRGNVIDGNLIEGPASSGISIENEFNEIVDNEVLGAGGAGIRVQGSSLLPFEVRGNVIGGDLPLDENVVSESGGDAIEITNLAGTANEVARNRGTGNQGLFIDLVAASPGETKWPNNGIAPPVFTTSTQVDASGAAAESATIRVFRKQSPSTGELDSFLGKAIADGDGNWKVVYGDAIPPGSIVAATQTDLAGGTSELSTATVNSGPDTGAGDEGEGSPGAVGFAVDVIQPKGRLGGRRRPRTRIVRAPKKARDGTARFKFRSNERGSRFLCKLDRRPFDLCSSPRTYRHLSPGRHVFQVRAVDASGHIDRTPAKRKFIVFG